MALAYLGYTGDGPSISFRIDPEAIEWQFNVNVKVFHTIGGRVIQVLGGTLGDMVITGSIGEDRNLIDSDGTYLGESWRLHRQFVERIRAIMEHQSVDATIHRDASSRMHRPARFIYPPKDWNFEVYVKAISDPDGGSITQRTGKFSHKYRLVLFIVEPDSQRVRKVKDQAIENYINRISEGMGWKYSEYNGVGWENLDPYSDTWGEDLDLSSISDDPLAGNDFEGDIGSSPGPGTTETSTNPNSSASTGQIIRRQ